MRLRDRTAIITILLVSIGASVLAADRDTLKNLRAVDVLIDGLSPEAESDGLTRALLQGDIEMRLRESGLEINKNASETFYVNVNAHRTTTPGTNTSDGGYLYNIQVDLHQPVTVVRTNAVAIAATWSRATVGMTFLTRLAESVRGDVSDVLDLFLEDFLAVNPKP